MSDAEYSNYSRRELMRHLALGASSFALVGSGCESCRSKPTKPKQASRLLRFYGTGTLNVGDEGWAIAERDIGVKLKFKDNGNDTGPVISKMIAGSAARDFDIGGLQGGAERELARAGKILPWDLSKIPNWSRIWPWARDQSSAQVDGKQFGLPVVINADSIIYLPEKVGMVDSYAAVFDPKWKGRAAMEDAWINSAIFTAIFLKENGLAKIRDPGDLEESELEAVMTFLIEKKRSGQFRKFWNGWEEGVRLITSGEVHVMTGWEPIVYEARRKGVSAAYAVPKEGYEGWSNNLILHQGAAERDVVSLAHAFANWELSGYYGCRLAIDRGYVVPTSAAVEHARGLESGFDAEKVRGIVDHVERKFSQMKGKVYWQNVRPKNYKLYEEWWSRLRSV